MIRHHIISQTIVYIGSDAAAGPHDQTGKCARSISHCRRVGRF